jgi:Trk-type K+ transport system membrane component
LTKCFEKNRFDFCSVFKAKLLERQQAIQTRIGAIKAAVSVEIKKRAEEAAVRSEQLGEQFSFRFFFFFFFLVSRFMMIALKAERDVKVLTQTCAHFSKFDACNSKCE